MKKFIKITCIVLYLITANAHSQSLEEFMLALGKVGGRALACKNLIAAKDVLDARNALLAAAIKNRYIDEKKAEELHAAHLNEAKKSETNASSKSKESCELVDQELKNIKLKLGLTTPKTNEAQDKYLNDKIGILCSSCKEDECFNSNITNIDGTLNGLAFILTEKRELGTNRFAFFSLNDKWEISEGLYEAQDSWYMLTLRTKNTYYNDNTYIDRYTGIATTKIFQRGIAEISNKDEPHKNSKEYFCKNIPAAEVRKVWFGQKRERFLGNRKF